MIFYLGWQCQVWKNKTLLDWHGLRVARYNICANYYDFDLKNSTKTGTIAGKLEKKFTVKQFWEIKCRTLFQSHIIVFESEGEGKLIQNLDKQKGGGKSNNCKHIIFVHLDAPKSDGGATPTKYHFRYVNFRKMLR